MTLGLPFTFGIDIDRITMTHSDSSYQRRLSDLRGYFHDEAAYAALLAKEDTLLYEVQEIKRPHEAGELPCGLSIFYPGKVGDEYFMTKGHFHEVLETGEIYYALRGKGVVVMETPEGDWSVEELWPGRVLYVPPRWAHRSVNTGNETMVTFWAFPGHAGHNYATIQQFGFRKLMVERDGKPTIIDNPRWKAPAER